MLGNNIPLNRWLFLSFPQNENFKNIPESKRTSTFALAKLINDIPRGEPLFAFPPRVDTDGWYCNYSYSGDNTVILREADNILEIGLVKLVLVNPFYFINFKKGYSVVGDPSDLFNQKTFAKSAENIYRWKNYKNEWKFL